MSRRIAKVVAVLSLSGTMGLLASQAPAQTQASPPAATPDPLVAEPGANASETEATASDLKAAIEAIKQRLNEQQEKRRSSSTGELTAELRSARETIGQLTESMNRLRDERDAMLQELRSAREESATRADRIASLERAIEAARNEADTNLAALRAQLDTEGQANEELQNEQQKLRSQLESTLREIDGLTTLVEQARAERDEVEKALQQARSQATEELSTRDEALASAQQQLGELEERLATRNAEQDDLNRELSGLRQQLTAVTDRATTSAKETAQAKEALEATTAQLQAERKALNEAENEASALAERVRQVEQEAAGRLRERTEVLTSNLDNAERQIADLETELGELRSVAATSVVEVQNLGEQLIVALKENEELLAALTEVRAAKDLLAKELIAAREDATLYAGEATRLRNTSGEAGEGNVEVAQLRQALRNAQDEIEALTNELIARDQQISTAAAEGDVEALNRQVIVLERQLREAEAVAADETAEAGQEAPEQGALIVAAVPADEDGSGGNAAQATPPGLNAQEMGDGWLMMRPEGIVFAPGSDDLADGAASALAQVAEVIRTAPETGLVRVVGHTDSFGDDLVNQDLSLRRARAVARALSEDHGIDAARLDAEGLGEATPIASNDTLEGRRANRRVEIFVRR